MVPEKARYSREGQVSQNREPSSVQLTPEEVEAFEARREEAKRALAALAEKERGERPREPTGSVPATPPKQLRLLLEGRVSVREVGPGRVEAVVEGDTGDHAVWWTDLAGWNCDCEAWRFRRSCAHIRAVAKVVRLTTEKEEAP